MSRNVVLLLPDEWRCTVTVERPAGTDRFGLPLPPAPPHEVGDCLVAPGASEEDIASRRVDPDTVATLYGPVGADFSSLDTVIVPPSPIRPSGRFRVSGEVGRWPLGTTVPLKRGG